MTHAPVCLVVAALTLCVGWRCSRSRSRASPIERASPDPGQRAAPAARSMSTLLSGGAPFRSIRRGERTIAEGGLERSAAVRCRRAGRCRTCWCSRRDEPAWRAGRILPIARDQDDQRLRGRLRQRRSRSIACASTGIPAPFLKRLTARRQRRSRALDAAAGGGHALRSARRADRQHRPAVPGRRLPLRARHLERREQRPRAAARPRSLAREARGLPIAGRSGRRRAVRAPPERAGPQPLPRPAAGRAPAGRGARPRRRHPATSSARRRSPSRASPAPRRLRRCSAAPALVRVVRAGVTAEALRIPIAVPSEAEIDLIVEDGDNPPLDLRAVSRALRRAAVDLLRGAVADAWWRATATRPSPRPTLRPRGGAASRSI